MSKDFDILNEYEKGYDNYVLGNDKIHSSYKISGNIFAHVIRKNIKNIIGDKYKISVVNSYIRGCNIEWDLLILKNNVTNEERDYNIYLPEHVECVVEFRSSVASRNIDPVASKEYIRKYISVLNKIDDNIKYLYVSLCEHRKNLEAMRREYDEYCFWIIEDRYSNSNKKETVVNGRLELKIKLEKVLKLDYVKVSCP